MNNKFKNIVIGSGAGGSVAALELATKGENVALIEEGKEFDINFFQNKTIAERTQSLWRNNGITPFLGKPPIAYVEGVALGGTTVSNGGVLERPNENLLDSFFTKYNISGYRPEDLNVIFEKIEKKLFSNQIVHNNNNLDGEILIKNLDKNKISYKKTFLAHKNCKNFNECISGCPAGAKMTNLALTYIPEAIKKGLNLLTESKVVKVFKEGNNIGIKIKKNSNLTSLYCEKLYISAGAIQSPFIILKNGLNNKAGKKISFHLNYKIGAFFDEKINAEKGTIHTINIDHYKNDGFSLVPANFKKPYFFSSFPNFNNNKINSLEKDIDKCALYTTEIHIKGKAKILSGLTSTPIVKYQLEDSDLIKVKKSLKIFCEILLEAGAKEIFLAYNKKPIIKNSNDIKNLLDEFDTKEMSYVCAHTMSSCNMSNNSDGIVDENGYLKNHQNIVVADNSILPESIGDSPQLTTMAFVHKIMEKQLK